MVREEDHRRRLAKPGRVELGEELGQQRLGHELDALAVLGATALDALGRALLEPREKLELRRPPLLALAMLDTAGHVRGPAMNETEERLLVGFAEPRDHVVERVGLAAHVGVSQALEEELPVEHEGRNVAVSLDERVKNRAQRRIRLVPRVVAVPVRVETRDHRHHRRRRPGCRRDCLVEAKATRRQRVECRGVDGLRSIGADVVGAERVRDEDENVHRRANRRGRALA